MVNLLQCLGHPQVLVQGDPHSRPIVGTEVAKVRVDPIAATDGLLVTRGLACQVASQISERKYERNLFY